MTKTYTWRGLPYSTNRVLGLLGERGVGKGFREGVGSAKEAVLVRVPLVF